MWNFIDPVHSTIGNFPKNIPWSSIFIGMSSIIQWSYLSYVENRLMKSHIKESSKFYQPCTLPYMGFQSCKKGISSILLRIFLRLIIIIIHFVILILMFLFLLVSFEINYLATNPTLFSWLSRILRSSMRSRSSLFSHNFFSLNIPCISKA